MALYGYYKDKVAPLHVMKAYRRSKGTTPLILNLGIIRGGGGGPKKRDFL